MKWTLQQSVTQKIEADDTARTLREQVRLAPSEDTPVKMLVDRLQELGVKIGPASNYVALYRLLCLPVDLWPKRTVAALLKGTTLGAVRSQLDAANGRRRERTLTLQEIVGAVRRARTVGFCVVGGGTVANSYKYPAFQTGCVVAVGSDGRVRVTIGEVSASKGASVSNRLAGLTARATADDYRQWADSVNVPQTA